MEIKETFRHSVLDIYIKVSIVVCVLFTLLFAFLGALTPSLFQAGCLIGMVSALRLAHKGAFELSKILAISLSYTIVLVQGFFYFDAVVGFHFQYLALMVVVFMLSDMTVHHDRVFSMCALGIFATTYLLIDNYALNGLSYLIPLSVQQRFAGLSAMVTFFALFVILFAYSKAFYETRKSLEWLLHYDSLTGIHNKQHLMAYGERIFGEAEKAQFCWVAMIDLDNFKHVNRQFGHLVGDRILSQMGYVLKEGIQEGDLVARYGGDAFVIIFESPSVQEAMHRMDLLRKRVEQWPFMTDIIEKQENVQRNHLTLSIGIAGYSPSTNTFNQLLGRADIALDRAKEAGKNCVKKSERD